MEKHTCKCYWQELCTVMAHYCSAKPAVMFPTSNVEVLGTCWTKLNNSVINPGHKCLFMGCQTKFNYTIMTLN
jgi:hypothetical protein